MGDVQKIVSTKSEVSDVNAGSLDTKWFLERHTVKVCSAHTINTVCLYLVLFIHFVTAKNSSHNLIMYCMYSFHNVLHF